MRKKIAPLAAAVAIPVLIGGWYLFRPELLFVNQKVNESLPVSARAASLPYDTLATGSFVSYAHETTGRASLLKVGNDHYVRLSEFKTSNGPDVHVYLVKGNDPSGDGVNGAGYLDLGTIKGNEGDQNYAVPSGTDLKQFGGVAIWCKRFSVDFGGAKFAPSVSVRPLQLQLASFNANAIRVTGGKFTPRADRTAGSVEIVEEDGKRFLRLSGLRGVRSAAHVWLVKQETLVDDAALKTSQKVDLGALRPGATSQVFPISKDLDAWLYRTVVLWDTTKKHSTAGAELRSDQERRPSLLTA